MIHTFLYLSIFVQQCGAVVEHLTPNHKVVSLILGHSISQRCVPWARHFTYTCLVAQMTTLMVVPCIRRAIPGACKRSYGIVRNLSVGGSSWCHRPCNIQKSSFIYHFIIIVMVGCLDLSTVSGSLLSNSPEELPHFNRKQLEKWSTEKRQLYQPKTVVVEMVDPKRIDHRDFRFEHCT